MARNRKTSLDYYFELEQVKEYFTGFTKKKGYDLSAIDKLKPKHKGQITRKYNELQKLAQEYIVPTAGHFQEYRNISQKKVKQVQKVYGQDVHKRLKVAFVPRVSDEPVKVSVSKNEVTIKDKNFNKTMVLIPKPKRAKELTEEDLDMLEEYGADYGDQFTEGLGEQLTKILNRYKDIAAVQINNGNHTLKHTFKPQNAIKEIKRLMLKYNAADYDPNDKNSSYYGNWLHSITIFDRKGFKEYKDKFVDIKAEKEKLRLERQRAKAAYRKSQRKNRGH